MYQTPTHLDFDDASCDWNDSYIARDASLAHDACSIKSLDDFFDDEAFADVFGEPPATLPIAPFTEDDLRFLRDFILGTAMYVELLESLACEQSDEFWQARENAYRIITALLIRHYEYELEG